MAERGTRGGNLCIAEGLEWPAGANARALGLEQHRPVEGRREQRLWLTGHGTADHQRVEQRGPRGRRAELVQAGVQPRAGPVLVALQEGCKAQRQERQAKMIEQEPIRTYCQ